MNNKSAEVLHTVTLSAYISMGAGGGGGATGIRGSTGTTNGRPDQSEPRQRQGEGTRTERKRETDMSYG